MEFSSKSAGTVDEISVFQENVEEIPVSYDDCL